MPFLTARIRNISIGQPFAIGQRADILLGDLDDGSENSLKVAVKILRAIPYDDEAARRGLRESLEADLDAGCVPYDNKAARRERKSLEADLNAWRAFQRSNTTDFPGPSYEDPYGRGNVGPLRNEGPGTGSIGSSSNSHTTIVVTADDHKSRPDSQGYAKGESINDEVETIQPQNPEEAVNAVIDEEKDEADQPSTSAQNVRFQRTCTLLLLRQPQFFGSIMVQKSDGCDRLDRIIEILKAIAAVDVVLFGAALSQRGIVGNIPPASALTLVTISCSANAMLTSTLLVIRLLGIKSEPQAASYLNNAQARSNLAWPILILCVPGMWTFLAVWGFLGSVLAYAWIPESASHNNPPTFAGAISAAVFLTGLVALLAVWCTTFICSSAQLPRDIERG